MVGMVGGLKNHFSLRFDQFLIDVRLFPIEVPVVVGVLDFRVVAEDDGAVLVVEIGGDEFFDAAGFFDEVLLEPIENGGEVEGVVLRVEAVAGGIGEEGAGLFFELGIELSCLEGFVEKVGAADGRAVDGEMDARVVEGGAQQVVFDVVESDHFPP